MAIVFSGFGSCVPDRVIGESAFTDAHFFDDSGTKIPDANRRIIHKFRSITGIEQRRYAADHQVSSDLGFIAARQAVMAAGIDVESLQGVICAHNYGDIPKGHHQSDTVPSLAARIKNKLAISNPSCVAFDVMFGCPGWIQSVIIAFQFLKQNPGGKFLVVAAETLSRVVDPHDRDSMIYADGAGAAVMENRVAETEAGILSTAAKSFTGEELNYLYFDTSNNEAYDQDLRFIKMKGRKIYEFALNEVPLAMKECLDASGESINNLQKVIIHQANEKMDEAILKRFYKLYGISRIPEGVMPMTIQELGNSSVATVPTLLDLILQGKLPGQGLKKGDVVLMASVGAGMNVNAITYRM